MGSVLESLGRLDEAESYYQKGLALLRGSYPPGDPNVFRALSNLSLLAKERQDFKKALSLMEEARTHALSTVGSEHPDYAMILSNLGSIYLDTGEQQKALAILEEALMIRERALGPWHPDLVMNLMNLVNVFQELQQLDKAMEAARRAFEIWRRSKGDEPHAQLALLYIVHGNTLNYMRNYEGAIEWYRKALAIQRAVLPWNHSAIAYSLGNLGATLESLGRHHEALELYHQSLAVRERIHGANVFSLTIPLQQMCKVEMNLKQYDLAEAHCLRARTIAETTLGDKHSTLPYILTTLGDLETRRNRLEKAAEYYEAALRVRETLVKDREYAATAFGLGDTLWMLGRERERAIELSKVARDLFEQYGPPEYQNEVEQWLKTHTLQPRSKR